MNMTRSCVCDRWIYNGTVCIQMGWGKNHHPGRRHPFTWLNNRALIASQVWQFSGEVYCWAAVPELPTVRRRVPEISICKRRENAILLNICVFVTFIMEWYIGTEFLLGFLVVISFVKMKIKANYKKALQRDKRFALIRLGDFLVSYFMIWFGKIKNWLHYSENWIAMALDWNYFQYSYISPRIVRLHVLNLMC